MFCVRIKDLREQKCITQIELAKILNLSKSTVAMWESNKDRYPTIDTLFKLSDLFDVSIDYLLGKEDKNIMQTTSPNQQKLLNYFNACDEITQEQIIGYVEYLYKKEGNKKDVINKSRNAWNGKTNNGTMYS